MANRPNFAGICPAVWLGSSHLTDNKLFTILTFVIPL